MIYLAGLSRWFDALLADLAKPPAPGQRLFDAIVKTSGNIERQLADRDVRPAQLSARTRAIRGWLAFFAQRANFDCYRAAVADAAAAFDALIRRRKRFPPPASVCFRPMPGIYQLRGNPPAGTRVQLPTPMICLDAALFTELGKLALRRDGDRRAVLEAMAGEEYQAVQAELESLGGLVERPAGRCHDLAGSFDRVNLEYFAGQIARPRLTWSRGLTHRKFGHYDHLRDTVMLSVTLDRPEVPDFVVDYVMYHELLHKHHGITWHNGQARVHTPQFKRQDRRFARYAEADAVLKQLSRARG